jgi:hypothetical protein
MLRHWKIMACTALVLAVCFGAGPVYAGNCSNQTGNEGCVVLLRAYELHQVDRAYDLNTAVLAKPQQGRVAGDDELRLRLHGAFQHPVIVRVGWNGVNSPGRTH